MARYLSASLATKAMLNRATKRAKRAWLVEMTPGETKLAAFNRIVKRKRRPADEIIYLDPWPDDDLAQLIELASHGHKVSAGSSTGKSIASVIHDRIRKSPYRTVEGYKTPPPADEARFIERTLGSAHWRIRKLYKVLDPDGVEVCFVPNPEQQSLFDQMGHRTTLLKARQLGFSTQLQIACLDQCCWNPPISSALVAHRLESAKAIFREKAMFSYGSMPEPLQDLCPLIAKNVTSIEWHNGSRMKIATSTRGDTHQLLHISEYGMLCDAAPEKAKEVKTGSFPSVSQTGYRWIESTAYGSTGDFYDICQTALSAKRQGHDKEGAERFIFSPWWKCVRYCHSRPTPADQISDYVGKYVHKLQVEHGINLSAGQVSWYDEQRAELRESMWREHPSYPDEAFEAITEGAIFTEELLDVYESERVTLIKPDPSLTTITSWDIGIADQTAIWIIQLGRDGARLHIGYHANNNRPQSYYVGWIQRFEQRTGISITAHILPHDGGNRDKVSAQSYDDGLRLATGQRVDVADRRDPLIGIATMRRDFYRYYFDEEGCAEGLRGLKSYRWEPDARAGMFKKTPKHDMASHCADALRSACHVTRSMLMGDRGTTTGGY